MKFLRRKTAGKPVETDFNDYVEPFPPARHGAPGPAGDDNLPPPAAAPAMTPDGFRDRLSDLDLALAEGDGEDVANGPGSETDHATQDDMGPAHDPAPQPAAGPHGARSAPAAARPGPVLFPGQKAASARPDPVAPEERRQTRLDDVRPAPEPAPAQGSATAATPPPHAEVPPAPADPGADPVDLSGFELPPPAAGRSAARAGRARTRLIGFGQPADPAVDPFARDEPAAPAVAAAPGFPVGWLVVIDGPGRGAHFTLSNGVSQIGRGADQSVRLDFGDTSISRTGHALLAFDDEQGKFFLGSGGKVNIVRLNGKPLLSTEEIANDDTIRIGETTLRFVAFCGPEFTWSRDRPDADGR